MVFLLPVIHSLSIHNHIDTYFLQPLLVIISKPKISYLT